MTSLRFRIPVNCVRNQPCLASKDPEREERPQHYATAPEHIHKSMCGEVLLEDSSSAVAIHHSLSLACACGLYSQIAKSLCGLTILTLLANSAGRESAGFSCLDRGDTWIFHVLGISKTASWGQQIKHRIKAGHLPVPKWLLMLSFRPLSIHDSDPEHHHK